MTGKGFAQTVTSRIKARLKTAVTSVQNPEHVRRDIGGGVHLVAHKKSPALVAVHDRLVTEHIQNKLRAGTYEAQEVAAVPALFDSDDNIVLEIGSGLGLISTLCYLTGKTKEIHCFEADPRLIALIKATHEANGVRNAHVYNQVLSADAAALSKGSIPFYVRRHFYGSSLSSARGRTVKNTVSVPTRDIREAISTLKPTIIICDIEGAELGLFSDADLSSVRKVMIEIHPPHLGKEGLWSIFDDMRRADFKYSVASKEEVLVFDR